MKKDKPKNAKSLWDILEAEGLNITRKTRADEIDRTTEKIVRAAKSGLQDAEDREKSATASQKMLTNVMRRQPREGHEAVHGTKEEKEARWAEYQKQLEATHSKHPRWSLTQCRKEIAKQLGVGITTIKTRTRKTW